MSSFFPSFPKEVPPTQVPPYQSLLEQTSSLYDLISLCAEQGLVLYEQWQETWDELLTQLLPYHHLLGEDDAALLEERSGLVACMFEAAEDVSYGEPPTLEEVQEMLGLEEAKVEEDKKPEKVPAQVRDSRKEPPEKKGTAGKRKDLTPDEVAAGILGCDRPKKLLRSLLGEGRDANLAKHAFLRGATGILLYGPSGTGKGSLSKYARALVGASRFRQFKPSDVKSLVGQTEAELDAFFTDAIAAAKKESRPFVLWFDEMDFMCRPAGGSSSEGASASGPKIFETWQIGWDRLVEEADCQVVVLGATNHPDRLPEAALDRFTMKLHVPLPTEEELLQAIRKTDLLTNKDVFSITEEDLPHLARAFLGRSYRNLQNAIKDCVLVNVMEGKTITAQDLIEVLPPLTTKVVEEIEAWRRGKA